MKRLMKWAGIAVGGFVAFSIVITGISAITGTLGDSPWSDDPAPDGPVPTATVDINLASYTEELISYGDVWAALPDYGFTTASSAGEVRVAPLVAGGDPVVGCEGGISSGSSLPCVSLAGLINNAEAVYDRKFETERGANDLTVVVEVFTDVESAAMRFRQSSEADGTSSVSWVVEDGVLNVSEGAVRENSIGGLTYHTHRGNKVVYMVLMYRPGNGYDLEQSGIGLRHLAELMEGRL
jgi:hypothetical protein